MRFLLLFVMIGTLTLTLQSCDDDDDNVNAPTEVTQAFSAMYPSATVEEWEIKSLYYVADFRNNGYKAEAWFTSTGEWLMTETFIVYNALPNAVKAAFQESEYADWKVDDVDMIERNGLETVYVIEVEKSEQDLDLYFSADGVLVRTKVEDADKESDDYLVTELPTSVQTFLSTKYPDARILEIEKGSASIEVDIIYNNEAIEVFFTIDGEWTFSAWDVSLSEIPENARNILSSTYSDYSVDDIYAIEDGTTGYAYLISIEKGDSEILLAFDSEGKLLYVNELTD